MPRRVAASVHLLPRDLSPPLPTLLPHTHSGGVSEQIAFTDVSVATQPDPVCAADAAVPVWDSAQTACVWIAAQDASIPPAVPVRTVGWPLTPSVCSQARLQTLPLHHRENLLEAVSSAGNHSLTLAGQGYRSSACRESSLTKSESPALRTVTTEQHLELNGCLNRLVVRLASRQKKLRRKALQSL